MLLVSALALGFVHGLGADHLMGIAALSLAPAPADPSAQRSRALGVAVRFAVGHALLLGAGAAALIVLGWSLPLAVEKGGELLGGALLIVLGALALWGAASGRLYGHSHVHSGEPAAHWHLHFGARDTHPPSMTHSHVPHHFPERRFAISSLPGPQDAGALSADILVRRLIWAGLPRPGRLCSPVRISKFPSPRSGRRRFRPRFNEPPLPYASDFGPPLSDGLFNR